MKEFTINCAHDFSVNVCGLCVPKNSIFGKSRNFYWYFVDFAGLKNSCAIIYLMAKNEARFYPHVMRTDTQFAQILRMAAERNFGKDWANTVCVYALKQGKAYKPELRKVNNNIMPMKNTGYELRKHNRDNADFGGGGDAVMSEVRKDHVKHDFSKYRPEVEKYDAPVKVDTNKWEAEPDAKKMKAQLQKNLFKKWGIKQ